MGRWGPWDKDAPGIGDLCAPDREHTGVVHRALLVLHSDR